MGTVATIAEGVEGKEWYFPYLEGSQRDGVKHLEIFAGGSEHSKGKVGDVGKTRGVDQRAGATAGKKRIWFWKALALEWESAY